MFIAHFLSFLLYCFYCGCRWCISIILPILVYEPTKAGMKKFTLEFNMEAEFEKAPALIKKMLDTNDISLGNSKKAQYIYIRTVSS